MANSNIAPISIADFDEIRSWAVMSAQHQDHPRAYRQPKFLPCLVGGNDEMDRFEQAIHRKDPNTGDFSPVYLWPRLISKAFHRLGYLEAMGDSRNAILPPDQLPTPRTLRANGIAHTMMHRHVKNLLDDMFADGQYEVVPPAQYLAWPNDYIAMENIQYMRSVNNMVAVSRLEFIQRQRLRQNIGGMRTEFRWVKHFRRSLEDARNSMFAAWMWSAQEYGTQADAFGRCLRDIPEMTRLMVILLEREASFEELHAQEHIFGCQFDKRIQLLASWDLSTLWYGFVTNGDANKFDLALAVYGDLQGLYRQLTDQALRLNQLFDYKYLWSWNTIKMWDRLYVIIRPDMNISGDTIQKFTHWAQTHGQIAQDVFGVYPITEEELRGERCIVCLEQFIDSPHPAGTVVLKTKCGHWFHPKCIIDHWDQPFFWWNRCPSCRVPALRLRDIAILAPQQTDNEHEVPNNLETDVWRYNQIEEYVQALQDPGQFEYAVQDAYWRRRINEDVLTPMHNQRAAGRQSWASVLGGPN